MLSVALHLVVHVHQVVAGCFEVAAHSLVGFDLEWEFVEQSSVDVDDMVGTGSNNHKGFAVGIDDGCVVGANDLEVGCCLSLD